MNELIEQLVSLQEIDLKIDRIDSEIKQEQEELDKRISALAERESRISGHEDKVGEPDLGDHVVLVRSSMPEHPEEG